VQALTIIALSVLAAITYGVLHDQITARICVEYFTIGHAPIFGTEDPTLLGLGWGVLATWWVGVLLGAPLAAVARIGSSPKRTAISLARPMAVFMLVSAICALVAGTVGFFLARSGSIRLIEPLASAVPIAKHNPFLP
jgi:hypothetical protein